VLRYLLPLAEAAQQAAEPATESDKPGGFPPILFLFGVLAVMYFMFMAPQRKRDKVRREMLASLSKGDRVMTNGGMQGTIVGLTEKKVVLRICEEPSVRVEFARGAVNRVLDKQEDETDE